MTTITVAKARKCLFRLLEKVNESHSLIHISGKRGGAVMIGENDWSAIEETLYLSSIPGIRESIRRGIATPLSKCNKQSIKA
jgi:PHD/YefM family antitoxin component YafN of YafNO toxin-antitoxin module